MDVIISLIKNIKILDCQSLNKTKFLKIAGYWSSKNNYNLEYDTIKRFITNNPFYFLQKTNLSLNNNPSNIKHKAEP